MNEVIGFVDFFNDEGDAVIRVPIDGVTDLLVTLKEELPGLKRGRYIRFFDGKVEAVEDKWTKEEIEAAEVEAEKLKAMIDEWETYEH
jgi:hypothetical protein